jgi:Bacterial SH3 domain
MSLQPPLLVGICLTALVTAAGAAYGLLNPRPTGLSNSQQVLQAGGLGTAGCEAIATDPNPPLNVRSAPTDAANNVIGTIPNGTRLTVVNSYRSWVQVSAPIAGWVFDDLVTLTCPQGTLPPAIATLEGTDRGAQIFALAMDRYHEGQLNAAIAQLKTVSPESTAYQQAQRALKTLPLEWNKAEVQYQQAEQALQQNNWRAVLKIVGGFPDIKVWRQKLAPIVKQALEKQKKSMATTKTGTK